MNRIDRLHAILTHLQSKRKVTAQEIADRFEISLRTVYRDVKALDESGVPVIGEAGSGYTIMEGYRLPPVMFTRDEASALLLGAKLAERFTDGSIRKQYNGALFKIKAVLRSSDKEFVDDLDDHIAVISRRSQVSELSTPYLSLLQQAIVQRKVVSLQYRAIAGETDTSRDVEPVGLLHYAAAWHLIGWCRLRHDYRDFRLSRMLHVSLLEEGYDKSAHPSVQEYLDTISAGADMQEVILLFDKKVIRYLTEQKYLNGFVSEEDLGAHMRMRFLVSDLRYIAYWLLTYTCHVQIESPLSLHELIRELVVDLHAYYGGEAADASGTPAGSLPGEKAI